MGPVEHVGGLDGIPGIRARFIGRIAGIDVRRERAEAMALLEPLHRDLLREADSGEFPLVTAEQVHGAHVAWIPDTAGSSLSPSPIPLADGLATAARGQTLCILVADCAPVWVVRRDGRAGALLHSGRKGTELGIVRNGIALLCERTESDPSDLVLAVGPCIRACCYETDFAAQIREQATAGGIREIHDAGICTGCRTDLYYSYRKELGKTGRMLATLTLVP